MINKYSEYLNLIRNEAYTGSNPQPSSIYWYSELEDVINNEWSQIYFGRYGVGIYIIKFRTGDKQYDYHSVLFEKDKNIFYLEDSDKQTSKKFQEKLKTEFWKNPQEYYNNNKNIKIFAPKCLGDISHLGDSSKYNL